MKKKWIFPSFHGMMKATGNNTREMLTTITARKRRRIP